MAVRAQRSRHKGACESGWPAAFTRGAPDCRARPASLFERHLIAGPGLCEGERHILIFTSLFFLVEFINASYSSTLKFVLRFRGDIFGRQRFER